MIVIRLFLKTAFALGWLIEKIVAKVQFTLLILPSYSLN